MLETPRLLARQTGGTIPVRRPPKPGGSLPDTPPIATAPPARLEPRQRLSVDEITSELGGGGRGTVYRARDTRLGLTVAIKIVGEAVRFDPVARDRFTREARIVASLTHPHICAL